MLNNSLPIGYENLKTEKNYIKISKLSDGEHKFRIVSRPIAGWIDWLDKKPFRYRPSEKPKDSFDPTKKVKFFWTLYVWDYQQEDLYIMEITQIGIIRALENYALNEDWGDLTTFDFKIKKEGSGMDTEYTVIPVPHKPLSDKISKELSSKKVRLEALYEGKDPWSDLDLSSELFGNSGELTEKQLQKLNKLINELDDQEYVSTLEDFMNVASLDCILSKEYERTLRCLEEKIKERNNESDVA